MRVFDWYYYNIADKVRFKDTKTYVEKMLEELGKSYTQLGFSVEIDKQKKPELFQTILDNYPNLEKYAYPTNEYLEDKQEITSFSKNWDEGQIYAEKDDWKDILEIFTKIPRPYNFGDCHLIFDGIDWYGEGGSQPISVPRETERILGWSSWLPFANSRVMIGRSDRDGNMYNMVSVVVEATTDKEPRDTQDICEQLTPYLGKPMRVERICMYPRDEFYRLRELQNKYNNRLKELFESILPETPMRKSFDEPRIQKVAGKAELQKAFKGTGFELKNIEAGRNWLLYKDAHNFKYRFEVDRFQFSNDIGFHAEVTGYNFNVKIIGGRHWGITDAQQGDEIVKKIVEYCILVRDEVSKELAAEFGDTPEWYWIKEE